METSAGRMDDLVHELSQSFGTDPLESSMGTNDLLALFGEDDVERAIGADRGIDYEKGALSGRQHFGNTNLHQQVQSKFTKRTMFETAKKCFQNENVQWVAKITINF